MGWGEPLSPSAEMVRRYSERMSADALALAVAAFLRSDASEDRERVATALSAYRLCRV